MGNNVYEYLISYMFIIVSRGLLYPENEESFKLLYTYLNNTYLNKLIKKSMDTYCRCWSNMYMMV